MFGKCANPYGHGHDYRVEVTVRGTVDAATGRLLNPAFLDSYVRERVLSAFDHKDMNHDVPDFEGKVPTSENLTCVITERLQRNWPFGSIRLAGIRIEETKRNIFEVRNG